jgi:hypothetical protein
LTLKSFPPFLLEITKKGQKYLEAAALGTGSPALPLRRAAQYKLLRDIILVAAKNWPARKSLTALQKRYPVGIPPEKIVLFLNWAHLALRRITKRPRWVGLMIGILLYAGVLLGLEGINLLLWLENTLVVYWHPDITKYIFMAMTGVLGFGVMIMSARLYSAHYLRRALQGMVSDKDLPSLIPQLGSGVIMTAFVIMLGCEALFFML